MKTRLNEMNNNKKSLIIINLNVNRNESSTGLIKAVHMYVSQITLNIELFHVYLKKRKERNNVYGRAYFSANSFCVIYL